MSVQSRSLHTHKLNQLIHLLLLYGRNIISKVDWRSEYKYLYCALIFMYISIQFFEETEAILCKFIKMRNKIHSESKKNVNTCCTSIKKHHCRCSSCLNYFPSTFPMLRKITDTDTPFQLNVTKTQLISSQLHFGINFGRFELFALQQLTTSMLCHHSQWFSLMNSALSTSRLSLSPNFLVLGIVTCLTINFSISELSSSLVNDTWTDKYDKHCCHKFVIVGQLTEEA